MEKFVYLGCLFDIYAPLLTEKEQNYFKDYYEENLSLAEIAENYSVSRNAVFKSLKTVDDKLEAYESKLNVYKLKNKLKEISELTDISVIKTQINELI